MNRIHVGDSVEVIAGKEKGKRGQVSRILKSTDRVVVKGLMMVKRHTKPTQKGAKGTIVEKEGSIHISNVMPIDPKTDRPTRVRFISDNREKVRAGKSTQKIPHSPQKGAGA